MPGAPALNRLPRSLPDAAAFVRTLAPGARLFVPGAAAEVPALMQALAAPDAPALDLTTSFVAGINPAPASLPAGGRFTSVFGYGAAGSQAAGATRQLPLSYAGFASALTRMEFDTCIVHVAPPDRQGRLSLGAAVEFTPIAAVRARRIVAVVNPRMPALPNADWIALDRVDALIELEAPLRTYDVGAASEQAQAIAGRIAAFVGDGATLQIGLGKVPDALLRGLADRRRLKLYSGMLSDGARTLAEAGALDPGFLHTSCVHVGSEAYYGWLDGRADFAVRSCDRTHGAGPLAALPGLVAVNSALTVDLFGQANLEMLDGRLVSGVAGAADFARAASQQPDGVSIVALPSVGGRSEASRIVPRLDGIASLPRCDVEVVITEHGTADLRGLGVIERAERLIAVAAPQHRPALAEAFRATAARF